MFGLFRNSKREFIFEKLSPSIRIEKILSEFVFPELVDLGFKFNKKDLTFSRTHYEFENSIIFQKSKWNNGSDICAIKPSIAIQSKALADFYRKNKTTNTKLIGLAGGNAEDIPNWNQECFDDGYYDFTQYDNLQIVKNLNHNLSGPVNDYFDQYKTYSDIVTHKIQKKTEYYLAPRLYDLCAINNDALFGKKVIGWYDEFKNRTDKGIPEELDKEMMKRKL
ncbi:hypothetical protein HUK80_06435 [Flavobacterium sp. MAH-1]|uniref:Uncharacterized protein n=1 Tax=Flavobacterium agri TaxID=2743471 RepID=A0A7Y8Y166_9FLAO|nr:hypothetical protein [Flavobacterium agri]NUY80526.1 hypothetical protein [Flavobacterium agri]NYA70551.1 hypothetical protein [Flavobacterium agri]